MATNDATDAKPGFWARLWRGFTGGPVDPTSSRGTAVEPAPAAKPFRESGRAGEPLAVPAMGEAYDFQVQVDATWTAATAGQEELRERSGRHIEAVRRAVLGSIWQVGREFAPHQALDAEKAMTGMLFREFCFDDDGVSLRCQVRLQVRPDPRVVEALLPFSKSYVEIAAKHEVMRLHADNVETLAGQWRDILAGFAGHEAGDLVFPYAARLADKPFAESVTALENDRRRARAELAEVLDRAAKSHTRVGLFEFAESYESALHAFRRSQGLSDDTSAP